ncbi:Glycosyltransferase involved in cell wall bisynthesis [Flavobacterium gillisiae]|uniref:Glycosyltransferase involved in cell wall bisynthesis n=1 Tax=Flavobacterium gillisiae TaxID=150146 RepID=A0A1H4EWP6_9FLAO|nr:glycosyltransferase [Flavobacterium gillisiae]SEA89396.1 Glycosyltransferase involved in cell wall bisynthesis [Flavobacterium gillisiae]
MRFLIITHVPHCIELNLYFAYAPYVREMNVWGKYVDEFIIVAPVKDFSNAKIECQYEQPNITFLPISTFDLLSVQNGFKAFLKTPTIIWQIFKAMKRSDHIHLRCPGNIGLIGCFVQILFPQKTKTAKYAGNWDPKSKQARSYRLQKWILSNTFLTRNMQVLVYGKWEGSSKNIKPFFTATYDEADAIPLVTKEVNCSIDFVFVGTLVKGKNPLYAIQLVERLIQKGYPVQLSLYGEGSERIILENYISDKKLEKQIILEGNQSKETLKEAYKQSRFVLLPSDSEGWPKAIAEGMFWGCVPLATSVSCVPFMLDFGNRGALLDMNLEKDVMHIEAILNNQPLFDMMQKKGCDWSRKYTLDIFEEEIKKLLQP